MNQVRDQKKWIVALWQSIRNLPKLVWVLIALAFIFGMLIKGSGSRLEASHESHVLEESTVAWWTCSMHPQIKLSESGQCPICFMDLIPLETEDMGDVPTELKMSPAAVKLAEITTTRVFRGKAENTIHLSGKVTTDETRLGKITAWVPGRLEKLYVASTGMVVKKGEPLVELYSPALYAAQEEFLQAKHQVLESRSELIKTSARITLEASEEKLHQLGLTNEQIKEIDTRGTSVDRVSIVSPMSGVVTHKNAVEGLYVQRGSQIYTIADLSSVWVVLDAYEADLAWIKKDQDVSFTVEAIPGEAFEGTVDFVDPLLNEKTRTVTVRLNVENHRDLLKPGMFVRADIRSIVSSGTTGNPPLLIPASAVLKTGKRAVVYVRKPDTEEPIFEGREIVVGPRTGDHYIVVSGLRENEEVVVKGNFKIDSAFQIMAKPSMMNPEGGVAMTGHEHHGGQAPRPVKTSGVEESKPEMQETDEVFNDQLTPVYDAYFQAQTALADDEFASTQKGLTDLDSVIQSVNDKTLKDHAVHQWTEFKDAIHDKAQHAHHWSNIEAARKAFELISQNMLQIERTFGHAGQSTHYEIFCPMAFNNKGASWLQNHDTVDNPYFGAQMLRCGEVQETFSPKK